MNEVRDSHRPADDQVSLVGSIRQTHPRIRQPASRVDADVAPLVWSHRVNHVEHHLKHTGRVNTHWHCAEVVLKLCWGCVEVVLRLCWRCVEVVLRLCWGCVGVALRSVRVRLRLVTLMEVVLSPNKDSCTNPCVSLRHSPAWRRNTEVVRLTECSAKGNGCWTAMWSTKNVQMIAYTETHLFWVVPWCRRLKRVLLSLLCSSSELCGLSGLRAAGHTDHRYVPQTTVHQKTPTNTLRASSNKC